MSGSVNKVILIGHLGKDPDVRNTTTGGKVASFSIATSERWTDKTSGEKRERTEWHNIVIFNEGLLKIAESYLKKGSKVYVEGELRTRKWVDQGGADRYTTEVVLAQYRGLICLLDRAERAPTPDAESYGTAKPAAGSTSAPAGKPAIDDEIPF